MNRNFSWNTHRKHYIKVWISKLLAIIWLGNIINAIYLHFGLPRIKKEILLNPIREKSSLQWCSIGKTFFPSLSFLENTPKTKLWKLLMGIPIGRSWSFQDLRIIRNYVNKKLKAVCPKKFQEKHGNHWMTLQRTLKVFNWPCKFLADRLPILST